MKFNYGKLDKEIKARMNYKDTLRGVGSEIGVSASTLSGLFRGATHMDIDSVLKICKWLNIEITEFIDV